MTSDDVSGDHDAVAPALLRENVADVTLDGPHADTELRRDLLVTRACRLETRNSRFGIGEVWIQLAGAVGCGRAVGGIHEPGELGTRPLDAAEDGSG